jgi:hypothetical protein
MQFEQTEMCVMSRPRRTLVSEKICDIFYPTTIYLQTARELMPHVASAKRLGLFFPHCVFTSMPPIFERSAGLSGLWEHGLFHRVDYAQPQWRLSQHHFTGRVAVLRPRDVQRASANFSQEFRCGRRPVPSHADRA